MCIHVITLMGCYYNEDNNVIYGVADHDRVPAHPWQPVENQLLLYYLIKYYRSNFATLWIGTFKYGESEYVIIIAQLKVIAFVS